MQCETLISYLNDLLQVDAFSDYAPNGWQIEGKKKIHRLCTAVTASLDVVKEAARLKADALLVHHGYFWKNEPPVLLGMKAQRVKVLIEHHINLLAYHLPLDCHLTLGNNAQIGRLLPLKKTSSHPVDGVPHLIWSGELLKPHSFDDFLMYLMTLFGIIQPVQGGAHPIKRIAWCTGAAQDYILEAAALGVDAYLSGEMSERTYYQAKELGLHYFACGHHATEKLGIQALGAHLAAHFQLEHQFIDSDNPY